MEKLVIGRDDGVLVPYPSTTDNGTIRLFVGGNPRLIINGTDEDKTVAVLQVQQLDHAWVVVGVFATKELAEQEALLRGYTRWSVTEFAVQGAR